MIRTRILSLLLLLSCSLAGCGTFSSWFEGHEGDGLPPIMGGVRYDLRHMSFDWALPLYIIDLPLSLCFDIIFLPAMIWTNLAN